MRLKIRKMNNYYYYSIIMDYTNLNGKRITNVFEKPGNQEQAEKSIETNNVSRKG
ncbi:MAG: hypothetical protein PUD59_00035 [bacterium]|nr:hypothetical protein [bacterium]